MGNACCHPERSRGNARFLDNIGPKAYKYSKNFSNSPDGGFV